MSSIHPCTPPETPELFNSKFTPESHGGKRKTIHYFPIGLVSVTFQGRFLLNFAGEGKHFPDTTCSQTNIDIHLSKVHQNRNHRQEVLQSLAFP